MAISNRGTDSSRACFFQCSIALGLPAPLQLVASSLDFCVGYHIRYSSGLRFGKVGQQALWKQRSHKVRETLARHVHEVRGQERTEDLHFPVRLDHISSTCLLGTLARFTLLGNLRLPVPWRPRALVRL